MANSSTPRVFLLSAQPATGCFCYASSLMLPVVSMASMVAPVEDTAATVRHLTLTQRPVTNPAVLTAAMPRVLLREGQLPEWDTYLHAVYGEHLRRSLALAPDVRDAYLYTPTPCIRRVPHKASLPVASEHIRAYRASLAHAHAHNG